MMAYCWLSVSEWECLIKSFDIVLDLALQNALEEQDTITNPDLLEEYKKQQDALDFIGKHIANIKSLREYKKNA